MTSEADRAWQEMVQLGQELDADLCWAWWESRTHKSHHRCAQRDGHMGLHRCCCGEETPFGNQLAAHVHPRSTPCVGSCPAHKTAVGAVREVRGKPVEVTELTREEGRTLLDRAARDQLGLSGDEFLRRYDAGELDPCRYEVGEVAMLIPFAREVPGE